MTFLESFIKPEGRICRKQYFAGQAFLIFCDLIAFLIFCLIVENILNDTTYISPEMFFWAYAPTFIVSIIVSIFAIILNINRLHDTNRSGWVQLIGLIPILNLYLAYILFLQKGTDGTNQYGEDPLSNES